MAEWPTPGFVDEVRRRLRTEGCVLLRNAVDPHRCHVFESLLDRTFSVFQDLVNETGVDLNAVEESDSRKGRIKSIAWNLKIGQVLPI